MSICQTVNQTNFPGRAAMTTFPLSFSNHFYLENFISFQPVYVVIGKMESSQRSVFSFNVPINIATFHFNMSLRSH